MAMPPDFDPFDEHNKIDQKMRALENELHELCKAGKYDEAEERARQELAPLHEKWLKSLYQSLKDIRNHPNFYQPK